MLHTLFSVTKETNHTTTFSLAIYFSYFPGVYNLLALGGHSPISLLSNGQLNSLSSWKRHPWFAPFTNNKHVAQSESKQRQKLAKHNQNMNFLKTSLRQSCCVELF